MTDSSLLSAEQQFCRMEFDARNHWLRATWHGFVNPQQALNSIVSYFDVLSSPQAPLFLNDNSLVLNPWFDSLTWLRYVWESTNTRPPVCVAHVMQPGSSANVGDLDVSWTRVAGTELQLFESLQDAEEWLHACRGA